jgi:hypothetical protein
VVRAPAGTRIADNPVQSGRRIATLRKEARLGPAIAFMSPGRGAITV